MKNQIVSILIILSFSAFGQVNNIPNFAWSKTFKGEGSAFARNIILAKDGGYYLIGNTNSITLDFNFRSDTRTSGYVFKLDSNGIIQWKKSIFLPTDPTDYGYCITGVETEDGVVFTGRSNCCTYINVIKLNKVNGSTIWEKNYRNDFWQTGPLSIINSNDGVIIAGDVGSGISYYLLLIKIGKDGSEIASLKIDNLNFNFGGAEDNDLMQLDKDNNIIVSGFSMNENEKGCELPSGFIEKSNVRILKINSSLNILWDKIIGGDTYDFLYDMTITNSGDIILLGNSCSESSNFGPFNINEDQWLLKLNTNGEFVNIQGASKLFKNSYTFITEIELSCDNKVLSILESVLNSNNINNTQVFKIDDDLKTVLWTTKDLIQSNNLGFVSKFKVDKKGNLLLCGDDIQVEILKLTNECNNLNNGTPTIPNIYLRTDIVVDPNLNFKIPITTSNFKDVASIQFSLKVNNPLLVSIIGIEKAAIDPKFNLVSSDLIGINWTSNQSYNTFKDGEIMFYLLLRTNNFSGVTDIITSNTPNIPQSNVLFNGQKTQSSLNVSQGTVHINQLSNNLRLILSRHMAKQGEEVYVSLSSYKFQGVTNMDFTLGYDTNVIKFVRFEAPPNNLLNMGPGNFEANLFPAKITSTWQSGGGGNQGITVPDGTVLGKLIFKVLPNTLNKKSDIIFLNDPLPVSIYAENKKVQVDTTNGYIYVSTISDSKDYSDNDFQLLPNPFYNSVTIVSNKIISNTKFQLFDSKGTLILHLDNLSNNKIEIPDYLPNGLYYYRLIFTDTNTSQTGKLIKNN